MVTISKLKLNQLGRAELEARQMNALRGGGDRVCTCSCYCENNKGVSTSENMNANYSIGDYGGYSTCGCNQYYKHEDDIIYCSKCNEKV